MPLAQHCRLYCLYYRKVENRYLPQRELRTGAKLTLPFVKSHAQSARMAQTLKKEKTREPPKITEWYFHAFEGVMPILVTAMAHGSIQRRLEPSAWIRYQFVVVASRIAEI